MPDKPLWMARIPDAIRELEALADPWVDRPLIESLLSVGRRRAQQLLSAVATRRTGASLLARREDLIAWLERLSAGETAYYETRRRQQLWDELERARRQWIEQPPVLVEVSSESVRRVEVHDFDGLPNGVDLAPGSITVRFESPDEALQKLMALAMAISRNREAFDRRVSHVSNANPPVSLLTPGSL